MKNLFEISPEEKDRIRGLHEGYKTVHGTTSLLNEQEEGIGKALKTPTIKACLDPTAINFNQEKFENEELLDCAGVDQRDQIADDSEAGFHFNAPNRPEQDNSCCNYYIGCMDKKAKNYYENDPEYKKLKPVVFKGNDWNSLGEHNLKALEDLFPGTDWRKPAADTVIPKKVQGCKNNKCCEYEIVGCNDPAALNYDENVEKGCEENKCCQYPKEQRQALELVQKNFQKYYIDRLISSVINLYSDEKSRNARNIEKLVGNYKIDNKAPRPMRDGDGDWVGFAIPLQPDTEAIKKVREKISVTTNEKRKAKLQNKLKELEANTVEIAVRFGPTILNRIMGSALANNPEKWPRINPEIYLRPSGSNKRGKKVYVGPKSFNEIALTKRLVPFLLALNKQRDLVPKTDSEFNE